MKKSLNFICLTMVFLTINIYSAEEDTMLPVKYEELSAGQYVTALEKSGAICVIPMGILEKHGPHLPLGTDLIDVRETVLRAAKQEYCIVFPQFYFGQIYEAKHQPGAIAYSPQLVWNVLQETCDELARNGIKKIVLVNGHGGNNNFLPYFCQAQLAEPKEYAVILFREADNPEIAKKIKQLRKTTTGGHADETETSMMYSHRPDLVHTDKAKEESGEDLNRLQGLPYFYAGIWWYAKYPNHYAGDGSEANKEIGDLIINSEAEQLVTLIQQLKKDDRILELQQQFYKEAQNPLKQ
jgi:creatinine amidohydrolase